MAPVRVDALTRLLDDYSAEQAELDRLLGELTDDEWGLATAAPGWDVRDQVSHLADTEEMAADTVTGGPRAFADEVARFATGEALTEAGCERGRTMTPTEVREWWGAAGARTRAVLATLTPDDRVPWGIGMGAISFVTARLMEHWAHGLDIRDATGRPMATRNLGHVAWIGARALPYAFGVAGVEPPEGRTLRFELDDPSWRFGPDDATDVIRGPLAQWCRLAVQRATRGDVADLVADGPLADLALDSARAFL